jgi:hypothetical protein
MKRIGCVGQAGRWARAFAAAQAAPATPSKARRVPPAGAFQLRPVLIVFLVIATSPRIGGLARRQKT